MVEQLSPLDGAGIESAVAAALSAIAAAVSSAELREVKSAHLADTAPLTLAYRGMREVPKEERAQAGARLGKAKARVQEAFAARQEEIAAVEEEAALVAEAVDVTTVSAPHAGAQHPIHLLMDEVADFFQSIGWDIVQGPEIEHEWFNFDALNFDIDHPARQMQDTLYVDPSCGNNLVMRTHTSPVQARTLVRKQPPVYMACPGKVFRSDELDQTHTPVFHQVEGLAVDRGLTMADLKGALDLFAQAMFGPDAKTRLRPSFFPFTEPSAEMDLWFPQKKGGPGWVEWGGCGMVNPNVLRACGIDPNEFSGYAFGMGIERTLMFRNGIADMHDIVEGDIRFTQQFGLNGRGH